MFDNLYLNHPTHGPWRIITHALPYDAQPEEIVKQFVVANKALEEAMREAKRNPPEEPRRYYG